MGDVEGVIVGEYPVTRKVMEASKSLKVISKVGVGVDKIDLTAASEKGIWVTNTPGANADAVADLTFGLMLSIARYIPQTFQLLKEGEWVRYRGRQLWEKTLGIVGLGAIGKKVAFRAKGFSMRILGYDIYKDENFARENNIEFVDLDTLFKESDFITFHIPLIPQTDNLVNKRTLSLMKPTAYLVNLARGGIVNSKDLYQCLKDKKIAGAALDVLVDEPPKKDEPLLSLDNIVITSHIGANTVEGIRNMSIAATENIISTFKDGKPLYPVNKI